MTLSFITMQGPFEKELTFDRICTTFVKSMKEKFHFMEKNLYDIPKQASKIFKPPCYKILTLVLLASGFDKRRWTYFQPFGNKWYFVNKIVLTYCEKKKCSSDGETELKFDVEGQEFANVLRSLEQFIQTVKGQNNFW